MRILHLKIHISFNLVSACMAFNVVDLMETEWWFVSQKRSSLDMRSTTHMVWLYTKE